MTIDEAIAELKEDIALYIPTNGTIEEIDRELPDGRLITALEMAIEALKKQKSERWIPVTEKLPVENGFYICTVKEVHYYVKDPLGMPIEHDVTYRVEELNYMCGSWNVHRGPVIAWMPLPEPYKEKSELPEKDVNRQKMEWECEA